jgi:hypothetical protein
MAAFLAEHLKEFVPEGLGLGPFRAFGWKRSSCPISGKGNRAGSYFIPRKRHC